MTLRGNCSWWKLYCKDFLKPLKITLPGNKETESTYEDDFTNK